MGYRTQAAEVKRSRRMQQSLRGADFLGEGQQVLKEVVWRLVTEGRISSAVSSSASHGNYFLPLALIRQVIILTRKRVSPDGPVRFSDSLMLCS